MLIKTHGWAVKQAIEASYGYIKALIDDTIKGVFRSIGDAGAAPINTTGKTVLQLINDLTTQVKNALPEFYVETQSQTIPSGEIWYIASGTEYAVKGTLTVDGKIEIIGKLIIV